MFRLYLRFYIALLASILLFGLATAVGWHLAGGPMEQAGATIGRLIQNILPPAQSPPEEQRAALQRLATGLRADVTLFAEDGTLIAAIGRPLPPSSPKRQRTVTFSRWQGGATSAVHLADGRLLVATVPLGFGNSRLFFHLMLGLLAAGVGIAAFPIVRQLTRRLERLQRGVESLGAGDLTARVAVEGDDEVARLATSFNRAASQIEQLLRAHQALLANCSHELRTPLARIRLAVELLKSGADARTKAGLEQDIAELDELVEEILLASRLNTIKQNEVSEDIDLLALAAEECSRYDDVQLGGTAVRLLGDPRLLRRLLRNLLENARRHGAPPTQVRIASEGAYALVRVWDNGSGPNLAEFEQLFTPFFRRRDSANRDSADRAGNGLGLSLVRQIARRHGGDARCEAMPDGRSGFVISLALSPDTHP